MQSLVELRHSAGFLVTLVCFAALLSGCGGGGGGGAPASTGVGNTLPPSTGAGDVENFFPNAPGTSWNYFATATNPIAGSPSSYMDSVTVTGTKTIIGQTASVFLESNPSGSGIPTEGYYFKNAGGVAFLGTSDATDTINAAITPYLVGLFPVTPGEVAHFSKNGLNFGADLDNDGINETMNLTLTSTVNGFEPLALGIGSFARTVMNTEALSGTVMLSDLHVSVPFSSTTTRWSAPGIGVLKTSQSMAVDLTTSGETMEARGYTSNGVAHGFGMPFTIVGNLPSSLLPFSDPPALATDGQNFFAASEGASGLAGMLFDSNGAPITSLNLAATTGSVVPLAAFDGTNYWVVYTPYSGGTSGSMDTCLAQRVSATGTLVDTTAITLFTAGGNYSSISSKGLAFGSSNGLLAYSKFNSSTYQHELHGVLVNPDGSVSASFPLATDTSTHLNPAVAFDGSNFLVVWEQMASSGATLRSIMGVRVSPSGSLVGSPITISNAPNGQSSPSVAFDGSNYLVVWLDMRNQTTVTGIPYPDVYGARVSTAGVLLDGPSASGGFQINGGGTLGRESSHVAFTGSEYLVTWNSAGYAITGSLGVQAARVATDGTLPGGANAAVFVSGPPLASTSSQLTFPVMAAGSQHAAIVWFDNQSSKLLVGASISPF